jgi:hypothetical protein
VPLPGDEDYVAPDSGTSFPSGFRPIRARSGLSLLTCIVPAGVCAPGEADWAKERERRRLRDEAEVGSSIVNPSKLCVFRGCELMYGFRVVRMV